MNLFTQIYNQKLAENSKNIRYWEDYVNNLKSLDFTVYADKLRVPALVPIGSRVLFRGELKHTSEVTVALGADYFTKCSLKQAEVLRQHRIKDAESKLEVFQKEKEFLENQFSLRQETVHEEKGREIVEFHTEEEDRAWREKHRENMRNYKQNKSKEEHAKSNEINDKELWERLEELELQEELENELLSMKEDSIENASNTSNIFKDTFMEVISERKHAEPVSQRENYSQENNQQNHIDTEVTRIADTTIAEKEEIQLPKATSKLDLLQKVIDKQNELGQKLQELRNKDQSKSRTEIDMMKKLDEMEELDELEDEMDRLEDLIEEHEYDYEYDTIVEEIDLSSVSADTHSNSKTKLSRKVSFADEQDDETLQLEFKHSDTEAPNDPYDPEKGIQKPSDIYAAFPHLFSETTSILKKGKYDSPKAESTNITFPNTVKNDKEAEEDDNVDQDLESEEAVVENKTIILRDVMERTNANDSMLENKSRPTSLFKMRRQQKK